MSRCFTRRPRDGSSGDVESEEWFPATLSEGTPEPIRRSSTLSFELVNSSRRGSTIFFRDFEEEYVENCSLNYLYMQQIYIYMYIKFLSVYYFISIAHAHGKYIYNYSIFTLPQKISLSRIAKDLLRMLIAFRRKYAIFPFYR